MRSLEINPIGIARNILNGRPLTEALLSDILKKLKLIDEGLTDEDIASIKKELEHVIGVTMSVGEVIHPRDHQPWVADTKANTQWEYWNSYKQLLTSSNWPNDVIRVIDEDTDNILTECGNPDLTDGWRHRGLVMGDVQSGKTANYNGLIAKAADAGYKVIILLTGMIEDLRKQTQERLDEGFVGRNSRDVLGVAQNMQPIGVGMHRKNKFANVLTSIDSDFLTSNSKALRGIPLSNINEPVLFVVKKNKSPLENLQKWLSQQIPSGESQHHLPLLIVDDEADNASVNTKKDEDPATINKLIREVLEKFSRSTYVAFTATPFANVFINPDNEKDLFPSNFIYNLNSPSNYIGAENIFPEDAKYHDQLRIIDDIEALIPEKHNKNHELENIPESLKVAVKVFLLSCSIRDIRKEKLKHRSMLVNVSRFTDVQARLAEHIRQYLNDVHEEIRQYLLSSSWATHNELLNLQKLWQTEFFDSGVSWENIRHELYQSIASIKVITINQKSEEKLSYSTYKNTEKGRRVIAVGGLTLSRGLTLEGLSISYFYRNSKAYDTLLQMGRWFGYRTGYEDLFRIWMDEFAIDWYAHISTAVGELRTDFRRMSANRLSPDQFGIRVKSHPDTLMVTALNKMRNSTEITHQVSFSAYDAESPIITNSKELNIENVKLVAAFANSLGKPSRMNGRLIWSRVNKYKVGDFLANLNISEMNMKFISDSVTGRRPLVDFVGNNNVSELQEWDVCIPQGNGGKVGDLAPFIKDSDLSNISCRNRKFEKDRKNTNYLKMNKQKVGDTSDELVGMTDQEKENAKIEWDKECVRNPTKRGKAIPAYIYRLCRSKPLLTIHFIGLSSVEPEDVSMMKPDEIDSKIMIAVSLSFPDFDAMGTKNPDSQVKYRLNKVAIRELFGFEDEDEINQDED